MEENYSLSFTNAGACIQLVVSTAQESGLVNDVSEWKVSELLSFYNLLLQFQFFPPTLFISQAYERHECQSAIQEWYRSHVYILEGSLSMKDLPRFC